MPETQHRWPRLRRLCGHGRRAASVLVLAAMLAAPLSPLVPGLSPAADAAPAGDAGDWIGTWVASPQPLWSGEFPLPTLAPPTLWKQTIRQVAGISLGGKRVRVVLSNEYGARPLTIGAAHVAVAGNGAATVGGTDRTLTFNGRPAVTIPPGAPVVSDPVDLAVEPFANLAVSLFLPEPTAVETFHWDGRQTASIVAGNHVADADFKPDATTSTRAFLTGILVDAPAGARAIVTLGDSITDGNGSTPDSNRRWPDFLARRMAGGTAPAAVLNAGISGARVLKDRMGEKAAARLARDVFSQPHVEAVIVMMGINDIAWPGTVFAPNDPPTTAEEVITGYQQLIARARAQGVRIIGATLTPFQDALQGTPIEGYYSPEKDKVRQAVNGWIRSSGAFDAVLDFDALVRDPGNAVRFLPAMDSGDHLHPGDTGYKAMADSIDLSLLARKR